MNKLALFLVVLNIPFACYYDIEEDLVERSDCDSSSISYSGDILPIVESRCYQCHAAALNLGGITLEGHDKIKIHVDSGRLLGAVKRLPGFSPMPQNEAMLSACNLTKIETWIDAGAPNN